MTLTAQFGSQKLDFEVTYSPRKSLAISVYPDFTIQVIAPEHASNNDVIDRVNRRAKWIIKQLDYFESFLPRTPARQYISGESHKYLGKQYRLKVVKSDVESVKLQAGYIVVNTWDTLSLRVKHLLTRWYFKNANRKINDRYQAILPRFKKYGLEAKMLKFKRMESRWGSCNVNQAIVLNPELIKAPVSCIDYVITHELCHIKHINHGKKFYQMLDVMMPDWEKRKQQLEECMV